MSLSEKFLALNEGQHYNTKVRDLDENIGSRKIRLGIKECRKMTEKMLNKDNKAPNPADTTSEALLNEVASHLDNAVTKLKAVKDTKKRK